MLGINKNKEYGNIDDVVSDTNLDIRRNITTYATGKDLSEEIIDTLNILTISDIDKFSKETATAGSFKWKPQKYPGDIDMLEFYNIKADSKEKAIDKVVEGLHNVGKDIEKKKSVVLADLKCGLDTRFNIFVENLGRLRNTYVLDDMIPYFEHTILGYNRRVCINELKKLVNLGALSLDIAKEVYQLLPKQYMTGDNYVKIYKIIRRFRLLRWSLHELLNKVKIVEPRVEGKPQFFINLKTAVTHETPTKLDLWADIRGRWTEVTNIYVFKYFNGVINKLEPIGFYFKNTVDEATELDIMYYSSPEHEKPYKLAKRIWNRAINKVAQTLDEQGNLNPRTDPTQMRILELLYPLFSTDISMVGQIMADLELFVEALEKKEKLGLTYNYIYKDILNKVEDIPEKIFRVMLIERNDSEEIKKKVFDLLQYIYNTTGSDNINYISDTKWDRVFDKSKTSKLISKVQDLYKFFYMIQNSFAKEYLMNTRLHPMAGNSIVYPQYKFNYLGLPPITDFKQTGGSSNHNKYYQKYQKCLNKYKTLKKRLT